MSRRDRGSAVIELVLLGLPLLAPLVYLAVALSSAQQARAGVTEAARQAGRAYVTGTAAAGPGRAAAAARAALADRVRRRGGDPLRRSRFRLRRPGRGRLAAAARRRLRGLRDRRRRHPGACPAGRAADRAVPGPARRAPGLRVSRDRDAGP